MQSYRSLHPNHVHQLTVSVSKHYWIIKEGILKYQSKPIEISLDTIDNSNKTHLVHYVIRDHASGVVYAEAGLSDKLIPLSEFLFRAWSEKKDFAFCGIPELLMVPKTVEKVFPSIIKAVALLGVGFPQVTSGFQAGVRDIKTIEEFMKFFVGRPINEIMDGLNKVYIYLSTMNARTGKVTKIELWREHVQSVNIPPQEWLSYG